MMFRHLLRTALIASPLAPSLLYRPLSTVTFMKLFETNKTPAQLSPVFKRETKQKGHLKSKNRKKYSNKLNTQVRKPKTKLKNHKGLLKRVKIVGPRFARRLKFRSPGLNHLRRHKTRANLRRKHRARYIHKSDMGRLRKLIPYMKRRSLKQRY